MLPLMVGWRIHAPHLPDRLADSAPEQGFALPGADELSAFAGLLSEDDQPDGPDDDAAPDDDAQPGAPFPLPSMLPEDVTGPVTLTFPVDFGALAGDHAVLTLDRVVGKGEILLGDTPVAAFGPAAPPAGETPYPCQLAVDLTGALRRGRRETLTLRFDGARPAGVPGPVLLRVSRWARLLDATVRPDAAQRTMTVCARVLADAPGRYALSVRCAPPRADDPTQPAREIPLTLQPGEPQDVSMTLSVPGERFAPGHPYAPPALKIRLLRRREGAENAPDGQGSLCDGVTLSCGYAGAPAKVYVPLTASDCAGDPQALTGALAALGVSGVSVPVPAQDGFFRAMARAGIGVLLAKDHPLYARLARHACLCPAATPAPRPAPSMAEDAWQLCGVAGIPRRPAPDLTPAELLLEAAGRPIDAAEPGAAAVLAWLRALLVRLRAEAARQGRYTGPLCAPGEWHDGDVASALGTALRPLHLSALPLLGAWWTGTRFSASIVACVPPGTFAQNEPITAVVTLEDEHGQALAELRAPCPAAGGHAGVLEAALPAAPCVLELTTRLMRGHTVLEESAMPVYVGERGPLEAAF